MDTRMSRGEVAQEILEEDEGIRQPSPRGKVAEAPPEAG